MKIISVFHENERKKYQIICFFIKFIKCLGIFVIINSLSLQILFSILYYREPTNKLYDKM